MPVPGPPVGAERQERADGRPVAPVGGVVQHGAPAVGLRVDQARPLPEDGKNTLEVPPLGRVDEGHGEGGGARGGCLGGGGLLGAGLAALVPRTVLGPRYHALFALLLLERGSRAQVARGHPWRPAGSPRVWCWAAEGGKKRGAAGGGGAPPFNRAPRRPGAGCSPPPPLHPPRLGVCTRAPAHTLAPQPPPRRGRRVCPLRAPAAPPGRRLPTEDEGVVPHPVAL